MNFLEKAKKHAIDAHKAVNHKYDTYDYDYHLDMAANFGHKFIHLIPHKDRDDVIAAIWHHDTVEDCGLTFNDLKKITNHRVALLAYACTNEKGKTRAERANNKYYRGIRNTQYATFVKLCDRMANIHHSSSTKSRMMEMYKKEHEHFKRKLQPNFLAKLYFKYIKKEPDYTEMWNYIEQIYLN